MAVLMLIFVFFTSMALAYISENDTQSKIFALLINELKQVNIEVEINEEHGTISIADKILFNSNEAELKPKGEEFLGKFVPILERVLFADSEISDEIISVDIEGYTSQNFMSPEFRGKMMGLSLGRSESVWEYINNYGGLQHEEEFLKKLKVCGWGNMKARSEQDDMQDRRVTFQLQFKGQFERLKESLVKAAG
jgi:outer membrane protein OmpA-like peptidoglycan-associated protein